MDLNKLKAMSLTYLQKGKEIAIDVTEKGKLEVMVLNNKAKLYHAQRQLGALVYSLAKGHEENQPLVDKYIGVITDIEKELERLKACLTPEEKAEVEAVELKAEAEMTAEAAEQEVAHAVEDAVVAQAEVLEVATEDVIVEVIEEEKPVE